MIVIIISSAEFGIVKNFDLNLFTCSKVNSMHYGMHCIEEVVKFFSVIVFAEFIASRQ